jgi:hypothetical protein
MSITGSRLAPIRYKNFSGPPRVKARVQPPPCNLSKFRIKTSQKMAKKQNKAKKQMQVSRKPKQRAARMPGLMLDEPARCWARLLNDPCNAPLCHPCFSGTNGGILVRSCSYQNFNLGSSNTAGYVVWAPGTAGAVANETVADNTSVVIPGLGTGFVPGFTYINNNAGSFRAVAACMKVTWGGTELNRQGYLRFGNINFSDIGIPGTTAVTVAGISQLFECATRVPEESLEIKWRPTDFDQQTTNTTNPDSSQDVGRRGAIGFCASSFATNSVLIVETTVVYEYQPVFNQGVTAATASLQRSMNTMDQVIQALDRTGVWMYKIGHMVGQAASLANTAYSFYSNPVGTLLGSARRLTYRPRAQIMG